MTPPSVLIVEDESLVRVSAADEFRAAGFAVFEARDSDEALAQLARHPEIDVLFTDIQLPGAMDGLALTRTLTATRTDLILIVTSGRRRPADTDLPDRAEFVPKPYQIDAVAQMIARLAAGFRAN
jgi:two-component system, response regulator PdtaR